MVRARNNTVIGLQVKHCCHVDSKNENVFPAKSPIVFFSLQCETIWSEHEQTEGDRLSTEPLVHPCDSDARQVHQESFGLPTRNPQAAAHVLKVPCNKDTVILYHFIPSVLAPYFFHSFPHYRAQTTYLG